MLALEASHEQILIALIGVVVATMPATVALIALLVRQRRDTRDLFIKSEQVATGAVETIRPHLPPNGRRLYEMVEATAASVQELQFDVAKMELSLVDVREQISSSHDALMAHIDYTAPMVAFVKNLMPNEGGSV